MQVSEVTQAPAAAGRVAAVQTWGACAGAGEDGGPQLSFPWGGTLIGLRTQGLCAHERFLPDVGPKLSHSALDPSLLWRFEILITILPCPVVALARYPFTGALWWEGGPSCS